ncbi:MAG TPA: hypothetical protein VFQ61_25295 [Polyangiaceae bacterium]|nr:hypothetical protein [Polyangiaceae bacterium]
MKTKYTVLATALTAVLWNAVADAAVPGWAGVPDPMTETQCWLQDGARLKLNTSACGDNAFHNFNVPIPLASDSAGTVTMSWKIGVPPSCSNTVCVAVGETSARAITFNADGTIHAVGPWTSTSGTKSLAAPAFATAQLQIRMKGNPDNNQSLWAVSGGLTP